MQQLQPNTLLQGGKYKIERVLGQGGFGITYLAEQVLLRRKVAVKEFFMKEHCNRNHNASHVSIGSVGSTELVGRFKEKFLKEAGLIASLSHRNIVQIYDIFEENGTAYYVMENIDGGSLDDRLKNGAVQEAEALRYIRQIADALSFIHSNNTLHLDIKPANILLRNNGEAVLIDFGISKHYDDNGGQTSTTPAGISKGYAPMEQYNQGLAKFTPATDIYSLGATLYKMVTGKTPPEASLLLNDDEELERPEGISFATWTAIEKAMEPKVKRRPQNVNEFLSLLGETAHQSSTMQENEVTKPVIVDTASEETVVGMITEQPVAPLSVVKPRELTFNVKGVEFKMIKVDGGSFDMKETVSSGFLGLSSKEVVQPTTLSDYWIGETQVTQALWKAVMNNNPSHFKGDNLPVESVSWDDCQTFVSALNFFTGKTFRLLTEAEWEFAARGGNKSNLTEYCGSSDIDEVAWYDRNSDGKTHPVATKQANELGIYDMSGNVWEWCGDWYGDYSNSPQTNPTGPNSGTNRVCRGGSWFHYARFCRSSDRDSSTPGDRSSFLGLRLCLSE